VLQSVPRLVERDERPAERDGLRFSTSSLDTVPRFIRTLAAIRRRRYARLRLRWLELLVSLVTLWVGASASVPRFIQRDGAGHRGIE
jgi:hypothetical protein